MSFDNLPRHIDRRSLLAAITAVVASGLTTTAARAKSPLKLLLIHGRGQQGLDPVKLKADWLDTLRRGAKGFGVDLPETLDVSFPYYGDILDKYSRQLDVPLTSDIQTKGGNINDDFLAFQAQVAQSMQLKSGVTDAQVDEEYGANPKPRGPLNWEWVQAILRALDKHGGGMSSSAIELFTRDVFLYAARAGVREEIDGLVAASLTVDPTVVIGHSLGSVVGYSVLRSDRRSLSVPLYLTIGCPLGIRAIRDQFRPLKFPVPIKDWFNAFDTRDVVALYPLDQDNFPVVPAIRNYAGVKNSTDNRHGIDGYLDDAEVSKAALTALGVL